MTKNENGFLRFLDVILGLWAMLQGLVLVLAVTLAGIFSTWVIGILGTLFGVVAGNALGGVLVGFGSGFILTIALVLTFISMIYVGYKVMAGTKTKLTAVDFGFGLAYTIIMIALWIDTIILTLALVGLVGMIIFTIPNTYVLYRFIKRK